MKRSQSNRKKAYGLLMSVLLLAGCSAKNPTAPSYVPSAGKLSFAIQAENNVMSGKVTISKGAIILNQIVTINNSAGSVNFSDIQVGKWKVVAQLFDAAGTEIYSGTGEATVNKDQTTALRIIVTPSTGSLQIVVILPATSTPTMTVTRVQVQGTPTVTSTPGQGHETPSVTATQIQSTPTVTATRTATATPTSTATVVPNITQESIVYTSFSTTGDLQAYIMNADGSNPRPITHGECYYPRGFTTYPGANHIVFMFENDSIARINLDGSGFENLHQNFAMPRYSRDGRHIAGCSNNSQICVLDQAGFRVLPNDGNSDSDPVWALDGRIVFTSQVNGTKKLCIMNADGSNRQVIFAATTNDYLQDVAADGRILYFSLQSDAGGYADLYMYYPSGLKQRLTTAIGDDHAAHFCADETRIVFQSNRVTPGSFPRDIYVMNADGSNQIRLTGDPPHAGGGPIFVSVPNAGNSPTFKP